MMDLSGKLKSSDIIKRSPSNPVLSAKDVPYNAALIFNAGVTKFNGKYVMVFRNDYGSLEEHRLDGTNLGLAYSDDGIKWNVASKPVFKMTEGEFIRAYDPRLVVLEGRCYMCFATDTRHGLRAGIAVTDDFENYEIISLTTPDNRNNVLFPEKINGMYVRLERPFPVYGRNGVDRFDIWISDSRDLKYWGNSDLLLGVEHVPYSNDKIGPGSPPVKTKYGWLSIIHAVDIDPTRGKNGWEPFWKKRYTAGALLLDLEDPTKVIGITKEPLIAPEAPYEAEDSYRNDVIFPGGLVIEDDGECKIYYGAADTVECLATAHVDDIVKLCEPL